MASSHPPCNTDLRSKRQRVRFSAEPSSWVQLHLGYGTSRPRMRLREQHGARGSLSNLKRMSIILSATGLDKLRDMEPSKWAAGGTPHKLGLGLDCNVGATSKTLPGIVAKSPEGHLRNLKHPTAGKNICKSSAFPEMYTDRTACQSCRHLQ